MEKEYKVVVVTPAGRKRYMEVLFPHILKQSNFIDEYRIWVNTEDKEDLSFFNELKEQYPELVTLDHSADNQHGYGASSAIHHFFKNTIDQNTVYIRLDDDIVWIDDNFFEKIYNFRINHPDPFLIFGNIVNNAICDHIHQKQGIYEPTPQFGYDCLDDNGWKNAELAENKHRVFLDNFKQDNLGTYRFGQWNENDYRRISINAICWFGKDLAEIDGNVDMNEEEFLSTNYPKKIKRINCIYGDALCVHFSFYTQREHLDETDILEQYKKISEQISNNTSHIKTNRVELEILKKSENVNIEEIFNNSKNPIIIIVNGTVKIINSNN